MLKTLPTALRNASLSAPTNVSTLNPVILVRALTNSVPAGLEDGTLHTSLLVADPLTQSKPDSSTQFASHPSPGNLLPSSQPSVPVLSSSPHESTITSEQLTPAAP